MCSLLCFLSLDRLYRTFTKELASGHQKKFHCDSLMFHGFCCCTVRPSQKNLFKSNPNEMLNENWGSPSFYRPRLDCSFIHRNYINEPKRNPKP